MLKKSVLNLAVGAALLGAAAVAHAEVVTSITITGGDFAMGSTAGQTACGAGGPFGNWQCLTGGGNNTLTAGEGAGVNVVGGAGFSPSITAFNFFGAPVTTGLAATATGAANASGTFGTNGFSGTTSGNTITLDLGGFYANWSGTNFLQGTDPTGANGTSTAATGTYDAVTGAFDIRWSSYITTAPFAGQTGNWHLTGIATVAPVPVPAAVWLLGSGLIGLVGVARRRKSLAA